MKYLLIFLIALGSLIYSSFVFSQEKQEHAAPKPNVEIKTFKAEYGWGYDVFVGEKKYIHQAHIPAVPGNEGFASEEDAKKTTLLMADKIRKNIMPPLCYPQELDSLKVTLKKTK